MTMTREKAIEILELQISTAEFFARYTNNDRDAEKELEQAEAFRMAIEALSVDNNWIPCKKKLPKTMDEYFVTVLSNPNKNPITSAAFYSTLKKEFGMFKPSGEWEKWNVVAWMYRPIPYKEGEDE